MADEVVVVDYTTMTSEQLIDELGRLYNTKPDGWTKGMKQVSGLIDKAEKAEAKAAKDTLLAALVAVTDEARKELIRTVDKMVDTKKLDGAEGVWFSYDFGEKIEKGINPACRLVKSSRKASGGSESTGQSSYVSGLPPTKEMLDRVGDNVYFKEDTEVTIDKVTQTVPAGTTFNEAQKLSTNGGWRNRVRMALGKEDGQTGS